MISQWNLITMHNYLSKRITDRALANHNYNDCGSLLITLPPSSATWRIQNSAVLIYIHPPHLLSPYGGCLEPLHSILSSTWRVLEPLHSILSPRHSNLPMTHVPKSC
jgi:hypothetical protein